MRNGIGLWSVPEQVPSGNLIPGSGSSAKGGMRNN
jgi:hypothetical protein